MSPVSDRRVRKSLALAALSACLACAGAPRDRGALVVAEVGHRPITAAELQTFLDANLVLDPGAEPTPPGDLARVKSRLFDDYLDSEILLQEAARRGITVTDGELSSYVGPDNAGSPPSVALARRDLAVQKLRESVVRAQLHVDDERIRRWLLAHPPPEASGTTRSLRTLRFASYPEAMRVRNEIVSKKLSLEQAEAAYGADSLSAAEPAVDLTAFPTHIATAVRGLAPGQVSQPLPFESSVLLFLLNPPIDPAVAEGRRREQARQAIARDESEKIADDLLEELRRSTVVVRHNERLPFPYVAEVATTRAQ